MENNEEVEVGSAGGCSSMSKAIILHSTNCHQRQYEKLTWNIKPLSRFFTPRLAG